MKKIIEEEQYKFIFLFISLLSIDINLLKNILFLFFILKFIKKF